MHHSTFFIDCIIREIDGEAKVTETDVTIRLEKNIAWFDIAMQDAVFVKKKHSSTLEDLSVPNDADKKKHLRVQLCKFERLRWKNIPALSTNLPNRLRNDTPVMLIKPKHGKVE